LIENNLSNIEKWLNDVAADNPGKALDFLLKLSEFVIPKVRSVECKTEIIEPTKNNSVAEAVRRVNERFTPEDQANMLKRIMERLLPQNQSNGYYL